MARNPDKEGNKAVVAIRASASARELRVDQRPQTRVTTIGRGRVDTRRCGIPPTGAEPGVTYRDVGLSVDITSGPPEEVEQPARTPEDEEFLMDAQDIVEQWKQTS